MTSTKLKITLNGHVALAHPLAKPGYKGQSPIVEITGTKGVLPGVVARQFAKVAIVQPVMFCDRKIPWALIKDARQGQIIRLDA